MEFNSSLSSIGELRAEREVYKVNIFHKKGITRGVLVILCYSQVISNSKNNNRRGPVLVICAIFISILIIRIVRIVGLVDMLNHFKNYIDQISLNV